MKKLLITLIKGYQKHISVWLQSKNIHCKYYPTCSNYAKEAISTFGTFKGSFLTLKRILKCNPFSKGGVDLVPKK